jgi:hypothetical protein
MNKRIKELYGNALDKAVPYTWHNLDHAEVEKIMKEFAELIVKEMLQTCEDHPAWTGRMIGEQIKQHFGVEDRAVPILSADEQALFAGIASSKLFTIAGAKKHFGVEE